jgi:hypothetical protein
MAFALLGSSCGHPSFALRGVEMSYQTLENQCTLESQIWNRVGRRIRNFHMVSEEGGVILHGQANSYYLKQLAQHAVMEVTSRPILANAIEVS